MFCALDKLNFIYDFSFVQSVKRFSYPKAAICQLGLAVFVPSFSFGLKTLSSIVLQVYRCTVLFSWASFVYLGS